MFVCVVVNACVNCLRCVMWCWLSCVLCVLSSCVLVRVCFVVSACCV